VCCDPCGCGNNCASGACAGTNSSNTGTLKPQIDNNFSEPAATYDKAPAAKGKARKAPAAKAAAAKTPATKKPAARKPAARKTAKPGAKS
ncbi:MAG: hypothetical protein ACK5T5_07790, partial [Phenylobacterium sp.]